MRNKSAGRVLLVFFSFLVWNSSPIDRWLPISDGGRSLAFVPLDSNQLQVDLVRRVSRQSSHGRKPQHSPFPTKCGRGSTRMVGLQAAPETDMLSQYELLLTAAPIPTKAVTSSVLYGLGDLIAQLRSLGAKKLNLSRLVKYMLIGLGSGVLWAMWYDAAQGWVEHTMTDFHLQVAVSILLEQFIWCPILYSTYLIPVSTLLNGGGVRDAQKDVQQRLGGLLVDNAKVWTVANVIIYSVPLEFRVLASNVVDLIWANFCADIAADCGKEEDTSPLPITAA